MNERMKLWLFRIVSRVILGGVLAKMAHLLWLIFNVSTAYALLLPVDGYGAVWMLMVMIEADDEQRKLRSTDQGKAHG